MGQKRKGRGGKGVFHKLRGGGRGERIPRGRPDGEEEKRDSKPRKTATLTIPHQYPDDSRLVRVRMYVYIRYLYTCKNTPPNPSHRPLSLAEKQKW